MKPLLKSFILLVVTLAAVTTAFAQEALDGEVVILQFDTLNVDESVMDGFYSELHGRIREMPDLNVGSGGDVAIGDFLLVAGCATPDEACLAMVGDFVDGEMLLFGSVQASDDVHMFSLQLFDFRTGQFVRQLEDQTLRGDQAWLSEGIPAVLDHFFFGPTATVRVEIRGSENAEIRINGQPAGSGSTTVENLPPGEMVVVVRTAEGEEAIERKIVGHNQTGEIVFEFGDPQRDIGVAPPQPQRDSPSLVPGALVAGIGVAGLVVGVMGNSQLAAAESEANSLVAGRGALDRDQLGYARELEDRMNSAHTLRVVGLSVGALGLAAGSAMIIRALSSESSDQRQASARKIDWSIAPTTEGVQAGFRFQF